jgi:MarR family 2-MHQ and catechol resistance regulon transcriptional repressor
MKANIAACCNDISFVDTLFRTTQVILSHLNVQNSAGEINPASFMVLYNLAHSPDRAIPIGKLSCAVGLTASGLTRLIDRLEELELVERANCASDRRVTYVRLTKKGQANYDKLSGPIYEKVNNFLKEKLNEKERIEFKILLEKLLH